MRRGEVWWGNLDAPLGRRPVVLVSRDAAYPVRTMVTIAPITTHVRGIAVEVPLGREDGLPRACAVNLDSIMTVEKSCLTELVCRLSGRKLAAVDGAIRYALGLQR